MFNKVLGSICLKRGAMFGLDARIALAIFGALSVISGAALYSAIQQAKVTSLLTEMNELGKAAEAHMLDTGQNLPLWNSTSTNATILYQELLESSAPGWKGPYFAEPIDGLNTYRYNHKTYQYGHLYYYDNTNSWGEETGWVVPSTCGHLDECTVWVFISKVDKSIALALDEFVDSGDGGKVGKLKYIYPSTSSNDSQWHVFYKVAQKM